MQLVGTYKAQEGVAYIELAIILMTMVTIFFGMVEITAYVRMKNKINQAADQLGEVLSTVPYWRPGIQVDPLLPAAELMMRPFGAKISLAYCGGNYGTSAVYEKSSTIRSGDCTLLQKNMDQEPGKTTQSGMLGSAQCADAMLNGKNMVTENPTTQFVVVDVSCNYKPYIQSKALFGDAGVFGNVSVKSRVVKPLRYHMQWDLPTKKEENERDGL
jgi:hypothetical protein